MYTGFELELLILEEGKESNKADMALKLAKKQGINAVPECAHCMIEVNSKAAAPLEAAQDLVEQLQTLEHTLQRTGLQAIPVEYPLDKSFKGMVRTHPRYRTKAKLLGKERFDVCAKIMGFHTHYDLLPTDTERAQQINFLTLFDPLAITLSASSPGEFNGQHIHNLRAYSYRYIAHESMPFQGDLQTFTQSYDEYVNRLKTEYINLIENSRKKGVDFEPYTNMFDSVWGPVRVNKTYETVELRSQGACPDMSIPIGTAILALGGMRRLADFSKPNSLISFLADNPDPEESFTFLHSLSNDAMIYGLSSDVVTTYCTKIAEFCKKGLNTSELDIVANALEHLALRDTYSSRISAFKGTNKELYAQLTQEYSSSLSRLQEVLQ